MKHTIEIIFLCLIILATVSIAYGVSIEDMASYSDAQLGNLITLTQEPTTIDLENVNFNFIINTYRTDPVNSSTGYTPFSYAWTGTIPTPLAFECVGLFGFETCFTLLVLTDYEYDYEQYHIQPVLWQWNQQYAIELETLRELRQEANDTITLRTYQEALEGFQQWTLPTTTSTTPVSSTTI